MGYKEGELEILHTHLYDILKVIHEVCERLGITYFIVGGTAIGAHFEQAILPWDDDIDVGMERCDYQRFITEAQQYIASGYTIQSPLSEPNTPYYFTKVRKDNTHFEPIDELDLPIHHGIYVDIFPLDRVPISKSKERRQMWQARQLVNAFVATTIPLRNGGAVQRFIVNIFAKLCGKKRIYNMLTSVLTRYDSDESAEYINIIRMPRDHIAIQTVRPPELRPFGGLEIFAPRQLIDYLVHHYSPLRHHIPKEEQINHAPKFLNFNSSTRQ